MNLKLTYDKIHNAGLNNRKIIYEKPKNKILVKPTGKMAHNKP